MLFVFGYLLHNNPYFFYSRLEEKFSDVESENQILRQQALLKTPVKRIADILSTPEKNQVYMCYYIYSPSSCSPPFSCNLYVIFALQGLENGHHLSEENGANVT